VGDGIALIVVACGAGLPSPLHARIVPQWEVICNG
jgi:hypothetical protein